MKYVTESVYEFKLLQPELEYLRDQFWQADSFEIVHTKSPLMRDVYEKIRSVAPAKSTVLLLGETGTEKGGHKTGVPGTSSNRTWVYFAKMFERHI